MYRQILWSSAVLASAHHHTQFVLDALRHVKPMKVGVQCWVSAGKNLLLPDNQV